ncbi:hypothetical protein CH75_16795 [Dyella jiangningensis]|nr:hypothetical protein CH75_16795 [Dyella jiangningensis]
MDGGAADEDTVPAHQTIYSDELHAAVRAKVPGAVYEVMRGTLRRQDIDAAWNLTDTEVECLMSLAPKREQPRANKASAAIQAVPTRAHPLLANAIWEKYSRLVALAGDKRAGQLIDEIAFAATLGNLANGDQLASVRIIISIIARGTWTTPRGFTQDWRGAVLRGISATPTGNGVAQISMH